MSLETPSRNVSASPKRASEAETASWSYIRLEVVGLLEVDNSYSMRARFLAHPVTAVCRPPTSEESRALVDFEWHARQCTACAYPYLRCLNGLYLCRSGLSHGRRLARLMHQHNSKTYSASSSPELRVMVELQGVYRCCVEFLRTASWHLSALQQKQKWISKGVVVENWILVRSDKVISTSYFSRTSYIH